jgi:hypothetical protein
MTASITDTQSSGCFGFRSTSDGVFIRQPVRVDSDQVSISNNGPNDIQIGESIFVEEQTAVTQRPIWA